jgi:uncharacterized protein YqcC (DUF446 family)
VVVSKQYLPRMEEMFIEEEGVPKEITRLPFVESSFVNEARSISGSYSEFGSSCPKQQQ